MASELILNKPLGTTAGYVVSADKIAYSTETRNVGQPNEIQVMTKSLAAKIDEVTSEINQALLNAKLDASKIIYKEAVGNPGDLNYQAPITVSDILENLENLDLQTIAQAASNATTASLAAQASAAVATNTYAKSQEFLNSITTLKDDTLTAIQTEKTNVIQDIKNNIGKLDQLSTIASQLNVSFNSESPFAIIEENEFKRADEDNNLNSDTIYFCYDPIQEDLDPLYASVIVESSDLTMGNVSGSCAYKKREDVVTLMAAPKTGYKFVKWYDATDESKTAISTELTYAIPAVEEKAEKYIGQFARQETYNTISVISDDTQAGTATIGLNSSIYNKQVETGSSVSLYATVTDSEHYIFTGWTNNKNNSVENINPLTVNVTSDVAYVAHYRYKDYVNISATVEPDASYGTVEGVGVHKIGTPAIIKAIPNNAGNVDDPWYEFVNWNNSITANPYTFDVVDVANYTAKFNKLVDFYVNSIDASISNLTSVIITVDNIAYNATNATIQYAGFSVKKSNGEITKYPLNKVITLTPNNTFETKVYSGQFDWNGATVEYKINQLGLTPHLLSFGSMQNGTLIVAPVKEKYAKGDVIEVTPNPESGYTCINVTSEQVELTSENGRYHFEFPDTNVTLNATFEQTTFTVSIEQNPNGTIEIDNETFEKNGDITEINVTVTPTSGQYQVESIICKYEDSELEDSVYTLEELTSASVQHSFPTQNCNMLISATYKPILIENELTPGEISDANNAEGTLQTDEPNQEVNI